MRNTASLTALSATFRHCRSPAAVAGILVLLLAAAVCPAQETPAEQAGAADNDSMDSSVTRYLEAITERENNHGAFDPEDGLSG